MDQHSTYGFGGHLTELEVALGTTRSEQLGQVHGVGDIERYFARMRAVEYAIEHDDGQGGRAVDIADVIIIAPSRCGKTPTTMYLALQYGLLVGNYPLTDDDFPTDDPPRAVSRYAARCFGLMTTPLRLSQVRHERRPASVYSSLAQCTLELRRAEDLYLGTVVLNHVEDGVGRLALQEDDAHLAPFDRCSRPRVLRRFG